MSYCCKHVIRLSYNAKRYNIGEEVSTYVSLFIGMSSLVFLIVLCNGFRFIYCNKREFQVVWNIAADQSHRERKWITGRPFRTREVNDIILLFVSGWTFPQSVVSPLKLTLQSFDLFYSYTRIQNTIIVSYIKTLIIICKIQPNQNTIIIIYLVKL